MVRGRIVSHSGAWSRAQWDSGPSGSGRRARLAAGSTSNLELMIGLQNDSSERDFNFLKPVLT